MPEGIDPDRYRRRCTRPRTAAEVARRAAICRTCPDYDREPGSCRLLVAKRKCRETELEQLQLAGDCPADRWP